MLSDLFQDGNSRVVVTTIESVHSLYVFLHVNKTLAYKPQTKTSFNQAHGNINIRWRDEQGTKERGMGRGYPSMKANLAVHG